MSKIAEFKGIICYNVESRDSDLCGEEAREVNFRHQFRIVSFAFLLRVAVVWLHLNVPFNKTQSPPDSS